MRGIYPDWIGPTAADRHLALYPHWLGGATIDAIPPLPWLGGALVLPPTYGIAMVASTLGSIVGNVYASMISVIKNVDTTTQGEPGVEVKDQEPGT